MAVLEPIWNEKRETARRVKQRISAICRWAVAQGHRTDDPAGVVIDAALPRNGVKRRHMPALPYEDVAECIAKVRASARASESSKLALEFLVLTAARSGEVRKATWDEIDLDGRDVDGAGRAHEGEPRASGAAVEARTGGARGRGGA